MQIDSSKLQVYSNGEEASFYLERADLGKYMPIGDASGFSGKCTDVGPNLKWDYDRRTRHLMGKE